MVDKKVLIIGCSLSGLAVANFLLNKGYNVFVTEYGKLSEKYAKDVQSLKNRGARFEFEGHTKDFIEGTNFAVTSPSVPKSSLVFNLLADAGVEVYSELDIAYKFADKKDAFIGITGTNGKTTTTSAVAHLLSQKFRANACGNIGIPPTSLDAESVDWFVTEISSFQLEQSSEFKAHIACWTNFTPDHITWHGSLENYFNAKAKLFLNQTKNDYAILNGTDAALMEFAPNCKGQLFIFDKEVENNCCYLSNDSFILKINGIPENVINIKECLLSGHHNYQNLMCAIIISKLAGLSINEIRNGLKTFKAPEHRMEQFAKYNGITFYNDSKATNPESSIAAINAFSEEMVLIAGGRDKLTPLGEFCESVANHASAIILIGEATERFKKELHSCGYSKIHEANSLQTAVDKAIELSPKAVLLSPACASFDMFSSYEERGKVFKEYVLSKISK